jgi:GNAT superfamily N-acetyltransferase
MAGQTYNIVERLPTVEEYQALRRAAGWAEVDAEAVARGLVNSLFSVCVVCGERPSEEDAESQAGGSVGVSPAQFREDGSAGASPAARGRGPLLGSAGASPSRSSEHGDIIGCGRVVGDGGVYFYVQDVMVLPAYQRQGLGRRIMDAIMAYISAHAGSNSFIGLMAANGVAPFYYRYGFTERPPNRPGMFRMWQT